MKFLFAILSGGIAIASLLSSSPAQAQRTRVPDAHPNGYVLPETEVFDMTAKDGETYRIYISRPEGEAPERGYPVLYVLDGNAIFAGFAETRRIQGVYDGGMEDLIIVGVGTPDKELYNPVRLAYFTPPIKSEALRDLYKDYTAGGRDAFEKFLMEELRPEIAARFDINQSRQSLYGHSLGGLFGLHMLYSRPGAFHTIVATSPTIWWDEQFILNEEEDFRRMIKKDPSLARKSRILVMTGEREEAEVTVGDSIALAKRLEEFSVYGVRSEFALLKDEGHMTVPSRSITSALRYVMQQP